MVGRAPAYAAGASNEAGSSANGEPALSRGLSLERLLELAPLTPEQGAAVGIAVLHQLALTTGGLQPGRLQPRNLRVLPDGDIAMPERQGSAPGPDEQRELLKAAGRLACSALGVDVEPDPEQGFTAAETVALPLVVFVRSLALGALGADVVSAARQCAERAGRFGSAERLSCSKEELGALVTRLLQSAGGPPPAPAHAASVSSTPGRRPAAPRGRGPLLVAGSALLLLVAASASTLGAAALAPHPARPSAAAVTPSIPAAAPAALPPVSIAIRPPPSLPVYAPAAAGAIRSVQGQMVGGCASGARCSLDVGVYFLSRRSPLSIAWKFEVFDRCTGGSVELPGGAFTAPAGWNHILIRTPLQMPPGKAPAIVVVTTVPAAAASPAISPAPPDC